MTTLTAIQTNYAGCRFRSRLEARWAVFFNELDIMWQYEPQGYTVGPDATAYLPDFWLPDAQLWVEVKGALEQRDLETLIWSASAAGLPAVGPSSTNPCRPADVWPWRGRILLLGDIPDAADRAVAHRRLDSIGDLVVAQMVIIRPGPALVSVFAPEPVNQFVAGEQATGDRLKRLMTGYELPFVEAHPRVAKAYRAARSARFEHGETPA